MSDDQERDLRAIYSHGVLIAWERNDIDRWLSEGWISEDDFQELCARHPYALEAARKDRNSQSQPT
jgi:hypothetical protein